jgi:peptidyl-prolyl cis-trans isomerase B (cyclophilin B)
MKKFLSSAIVLMLAFGLTACGTVDQKPDPAASGATTNESSYLNDMLAVIETNKGTIKFEFFPDDAPELTKNFAELAKKGYYDGIIFHRVINGFMIQGGDPEGTGMGGESYKGTGLADEEGALKLKHKKGAVSWAKSSLPNSIGSQFFIVHEPAHFLDGSYSVFGQVVEGQDVVDSIAIVETDGGDKPLEDVVMLKVYLEKRQ